MEFFFLNVLNVLDFLDVSVLVLILVLVLVLKSLCCLRVQIENDALTPIGHRGVVTLTQTVEPRHTFLIIV